MTEQPVLPLILLGAGGHAKVVLALAQALGLFVRGVCDPNLAGELVFVWRGIPVLGGDEILNEINPAEIGLINGIGQLVGSRYRCKIYESLRKKGFSFPPLVHPAAWVAPTVRLENGAQVMAGAVIQPDCRIGENSIINTRAGIDHDCVIGAHVHVAPGSALCGSVCVEDFSFIGSGSVLIQGVTVGAGAVVGAGATVTRNLDSGQTLLGAAPRKK